MGCDIHVYFETKNELGKWVPTFGARPGKYWSEELVYDKVDDGSAITIFGPPTDEELAVDDDILRRKLEEYFNTLSESEIIQKYGAEPSFQWEFFLPEHENEWGYPDIGSRNYHWFYHLCHESVSHRFSDDFVSIPGGLKQRDLPDDVCPEIRNECDRMEGDAHSHSWVMCSEILENPALHTDYDNQPLKHAAWIRTHIKQPEITRMVFFFDN